MIDTEKGFFFLLTFILTSLILVLDAAAFRGLAHLFFSREVAC
jgi:hypothetical protein